MKKGDFVKIEFVGRLETGEIFDLTDADIAKKENIYNQNVEYGPISLVVGEGFVIDGLDRALIDMKVGEEKEIKIPPEEGFGKRDPKLIRTLSEKAFERVPVPGMVIASANGLRGRVQSVSAGRVRVDFNNPLSGKNLLYRVKVKEKIDKDLDKVKGLLDFFRIKGTVKEDAEKAVISVKGLHDMLKNKISDLVKKHTAYKDVEFSEERKNKNKK